MANLFSYGDVRTKPRRSGFDLSKKNAFTAKVGEILPVYWRMVYPTDKFQINWQHFTRTQPVQTSAFTRIREYFDAYFVPLRLLNKNLPQAYVQMQDNPVQAQSVTESKVVTTNIPYAPLDGTITTGSPSIYSILYSGFYSDFAGNIADEVLNPFGFRASSCSTKLIQYLGFGHFVRSGASGISLNLGVSSDSDYSLKQALNLNVNLLPLMAYQKIYADFFRYTQWENNEPFTYNADYYSGGNLFASLNSYALQREYMESNNMFTLRYCNWKKDFFMGLLPEQQLGDVATVNVTSPLSATTGVGTVVVPSGSEGLPAGIPVNVTKASQNSQLTLTTIPAGTLTAEHMSVQFSADDALSFDILSLRLAEATQRWKEVSQCADQNFKDQLYAHWGANVSSVLSDMCQYIGGSASNLDINEVVSTQLSTSEDQANIKGKGIGTGQGHESFTAQEPGIFMILYHAVPLLDYVISGPKKELLYTDTSDLPKPEFDAIGLESVPLILLCNSYEAYTSGGGVGVPTIDTIMGYGPRFLELKTDFDEVNGAFRSTLKDWVAPVDPNYLNSWFQSAIAGAGSTLALNYTFFKVNPKMLDSIFAVEADSTWDTDQLLVNAYFDIKAVRPFDYDGMPY